MRSLLSAILNPSWMLGITVTWNHLNVNRWCMCWEDLWGVLNYIVLPSHTWKSPEDDTMIVHVDSGTTLWSWESHSLHTFTACCKSPLMSRQTAPIIPLKKWDKIINRFLRERAILTLTGQVTGAVTGSEGRAVSQLSPPHQLWKVALSLVLTK